MDAAKTVVVTGTGTEIGKTWVTAGAIRVLRRRGIEVHARKPVQSFEKGAGATDAEILAAASGEPIDEICPAHRSYAVPLAPPMAAEVLEEGPLALDEILAELDIPETGITFVEGVGGPRSPLTDDGDTVDLALALGPDRVVIVGDAELGTINSISLAVEAFAGLPSLVFLNRYDGRRDLHVRNRRWLEDVSGFDVVVDCDGLVDRITQEDG